MAPGSEVRLLGPLNVFERSTARWITTAGLPHC